MANHPSDSPTLEDLVALFTYHRPKECQPERYQEIRAAAAEFARTILEVAPPCADRSAAIRAVRKACLWANAAIALEAPEETDRHIARFLGEAETEA